ncbi:MAG: hypothetical protein JWM07_905, partial [Candidatus Saccharibacteria bacterium]|nr:hypothetical protein [Candidatus Saccharibacteria bacterium]
METVSPIEQQEQDARPYLIGLLDEMRDGDDNKVQQVLAELAKLSGEENHVKRKMELAFYAACMAQRDAIISGDGTQKQTANEISLLVAQMGRSNNYLPVRSDYPNELRQRNFVSGEELKVLQVKKMRAVLQSKINNPTLDYEAIAEAELRVSALDRYVEVTQLTDMLQSDSADDDVETGNIIMRAKDKILPFTAKVVSALTLSAITLIATSNGSHAAEKSPIDEDSYDPDGSVHKNIRRLSKPIELAPPLNENFKPPTIIEATPPSARRPDGSVRIAQPANENFKPPVIVEASPGPNINTIPNVPNTPPAAPTPAIERAPIPEVIIDVSLAGETKWTAGQLEKVRENFGIYHEVQKETGVPWEVMAALHMREFSLQRVNPANGQGIYQLYSTGIYFAPGPVSDAEFKQQTILAAKFLLGKAGNNSRVGGPLDFSNPDKIKDVLFAYNGLAAQYFQQAARLGFALGAEGSPYVMNMADDRRNSNLNPGWGQILIDNGPLGKANDQPGAWPLIEGLRKINQISHDQITAQRAAEDAAAAEAARIAAEAAAKAKLAETASTGNELEPFTGWGKAIEDNAPMTSPFGPRGRGELHTGEDYGTATGRPFIAAIGGEVKVVVVDIRNDSKCLAALANIGFNVANVKDPIQKEVHIRRVIDGDEYVVVYAHLSEVSVAPGQIVKRGQVVGKTGGSGCSTADHA